jgi:hypothetical protein
MKKGYLYLIFTALSGVVTLAIALTFKLVSPDIVIDKKLPTLESQDDNLSLLVAVDNYKDSWIYKLSKEKNQKAYLYPVQKFHIELF